VDEFGRQPAKIETRYEAAKETSWLAHVGSDAALSEPLRPCEGCGSVIKMGYAVGRDAMQIGQGSLAMVSLFESAGLDSTVVPCESGSRGRILPRSLNNIGRCR
jgi:hypothetical protein